MIDVWRSFAILNRLFPRPADEPAVRPSIDGRPPHVPDGVRVYAIGDVHGRADLLRHVRERISEDLAARPVDGAAVVVHVGDYVDRGFDSRAVLDLLIDAPLAGVESVHLLGNHDAWMIGFLDDPEGIGPPWLRFGGDATIYSYGVRTASPPVTPEDLVHLRDAFAERLPAAHLAFLRSLPLTHRQGDYLFVHAGLRPGTPIEAQKADDLLWIRQPFLDYGGDHGCIVVHGHTVENAPVVRHNRIGIDTGACWTGHLTCLVLEGEAFHFLGDEGDDRDRGDDGDAPESGMRG